jgi:uncharacterized protein
MKISRSEQLALEISDVMLQAQSETDNFSQLSGLKCPPGCGKCCESPKVHVSILDCLPLALDLVARGEAEKTLERIENDMNAGGSELCPFYIKESESRGKCSEYLLRPTLCRLFGFTAVTQKNGDHELALCAILKTQPEALLANEKVELAPRYHDYGHRISAIDSTLANPLRPIREAFRLALERVVFENDMKVRGSQEVLQ